VSDETPSETTLRCIRCETTHGSFLVERVQDAPVLVCRHCRPIVVREEAARRRREKPLQRIFPKRLSLSATANRSASLARARLTRKQRLAQLQTQGLEDGKAIEDQIRGRWWNVLIMHLEGIDHRAIADALGYTRLSTVQGILRKPGIVQAIQQIKHAQLERLLSGEFGVRAQARAAASKVMAKMIDVGQGGEDVRDADAINAGKVVLTVAGEFAEKTIHAHVHTLIQSMSMDEVEHLARTGEFPDRYRNAAAVLGLGDNGKKALPARSTLPSS
jgi:hypothetical protein